MSVAADSVLVSVLLLRRDSMSSSALIKDIKAYFEVKLIKPLRVQKDSLWQTKTGSLDLREK